jgi:predicted phosphodiesterase
MKKRVGILSDLHLENSNMSLEGISCDILVLAGDICTEFAVTSRLLEYSIPSHIPVIYVPGNHEYEGKRIKDVMPKLKELEKDFPNLHVLQNEAVDVDGIRFIGSTLWSNFEGSGITWKDELKKWSKQNIVDFSYMFKENPEEIGPRFISWNPDDMEQEFNKAYQFLEYELKRNPTENTKFVVTHFAPHKNSVVKQYEGKLHNAYWVNHLPELMGFSDYWVHGHTHNSLDYEVEGTRVICNPRGYSKLYDLSQNLLFDKLFVVEVDVPEPKVRPKM